MKSKVVCRINHLVNIRELLVLGSGHLISISNEGRRSPPQLSVSNLTHPNSSAKHCMHLKVRTDAIIRFQLFLNCLYIYNNCTFLVRLTQTSNVFKSLKWMFANGKILRNSSKYYHNSLYISQNFMKAISNYTSHIFTTKNIYTRLDFDKFESFVNCNTKNY